MKKHLYFPLLLSFLFSFFIGCKSSEESAGLTAGGPSTVQPSSPDPETGLSGNTSMVTLTNNDTSITRLEDLLRGKIPGLRVESVGSGVRFLIRGRSTFTGNDYPLVLVDGMPLAPTQDGIFFGINPEEIASVDVIRGTMAVARYGERAANGVLMFKSKK